MNNSITTLIGALGFAIGNAAPAAARSVNTTWK